MGRTFLQSLLRPIAGAVVFVFLTASSQAADWVVSKASGQVWVTTAHAQPASLSPSTILLPGDTIRTGSNGRVLLVRGEETILVAPNSVIGLPEQSEPTSTTTTILQQAGSIGVRAQKRDFNHFEVQTPYLAAVVKGTEFTVVVDETSADVQVASGQVQVSDIKSGQIVLLLPGQAARTSLLGQDGLTVRGSGPFGPVQQGVPGKALLEPTSSQGDGQRLQPAGGNQRDASANEGTRPFRISAPIGSVKLDVGNATNGLVRADGTYGRSDKRIGHWNANSNANSSLSAKGNGGSSVLATLGGSTLGNGNGNGNAFGIGNGNGNGNAFGIGNGHGNALGLLNGKAKGKKK
jgi:FecR protein